MGFFFGEGGVVPELGEVALRYFTYHFQFYSFAQLPAASVHQLARGASHRRALARHEGIVNLPRAAQQYGIGWNDFLVPYPNTVALFQLFDGNGLLALGREARHGHGKIRGEIAVETQRVVGVLLHPFANQQEKYQSRK